MSNAVCSTQQGTHGCRSDIGVDSCAEKTATIGGPTFDIGCGLRAGAVVYDGPPEGLTQDVLTTIYGEEDWTATQKKDDEDAHEAARDVAAAVLGGHP